jgi:hypothetical protein
MVHGSASVPAINARGSAPAILPTARHGRRRGSTVPLPWHLRPPPARPRPSPEISHPHQWKIRVSTPLRHLLLLLTPSLRRLPSTVSAPSIEPTPDRCALASMEAISDLRAPPSNYAPRPRRPLKPPLICSSRVEALICSTQPRQWTARETSYLTCCC